MTLKTYTLRDPRSGDTGTITVCDAHSRGMPSEGPNVTIRDRSEIVSAIKACDVCEQDRIHRLIRSVGSVVA